MQDSLIVRPVVPGDRARWEPLWAGYNTFYGRTLPVEITDVGEEENGKRETGNDASRESGIGNRIG